MNIGEDSDYVINGSVNSSHIFGHKTKKRLNLGILKAGISLASMIGVDIRSLICDKREPFAEVEMVSHNLLSDNERKHATYHGSTKNNSRPSLDWNYYNHGLNNDFRKGFETSSESNILYDSLSSLSLSRERQISPQTSNESDNSIIAPQKYQISPNHCRSHRRTSSNTSTDSSNVDPSFYSIENYGPVNCLNIIPSNINFPIQRPTYLNLDQPINYNNLSKSGSLYSPSNPSTPLNYNYDLKNTPLSGSPPQRTVRFNITGITNSILNQTLLDLPVEGQSQDGTIPLTALLFKKENSRFNPVKKIYDFDGSGE